MSLRTSRGVVVVGWILFGGMTWPAPARAQNFVETFADDPVTSGRWFVMSGDDGSRFIYQPAELGLLARYDTGLPTARLMRPLGATLTQDDSFICRVEFLIKADGFFADDYNLSQIGFGLVNAATTGPDRAGCTFANQAFDFVGFDYFPNITEWGGPSLVPTMVGSDVGQGYWNAIHFTWGAETEQNEPGEMDLPRDTGLTVELTYSGFARRIRLRVLSGGQPLMINAAEYAGALSGGEDGFDTTINGSLGSDSFSVDHFAILLWEDSCAGGVSSVQADFLYKSVEVSTFVFGRFDGDEDVDDADMQELINCTSGPEITLAVGCEKFDGDLDGDVDGDDFGAAQRNYGR